MGNSILELILISTYDCLKTIALDSGGWGRGTILHDNAITVSSNKVRYSNFGSK